MSQRPGTTAKRLRQARAAERLAPKPTPTQTWVNARHWSRA